MIYILKNFTNKQNEINTLSILFIILFKYLKKKIIYLINKLNYIIY